MCNGWLLIKDLHTYNGNSNVTWWMQSVLSASDDKHCHCTSLKGLFSLIPLTTLLKKQLLKYD